MAAEPTTLLSELPAMEQEAAARKPARAKCANCQRPVAVCLCGVLPTPKVSCATRCLVLQHPEEAGKSTGTVGLLQLSLESCTVIVGKKFRGDDLPEEVRAAAAQPGSPAWRRTLLLWPSAEAEELAEVAAELAGEPVSSAAGDGADGAGALIVLLDGTFPSALQMLKHSELLSQLRAVRVVPADPPRYVIRITPSPHCRSTLEAAAAALAALGGARGRAAEAALIRVLEQMVALQCSFIDPGKAKHRAASRHYRPERAAQTAAAAAAARRLTDSERAPIGEDAEPAPAPPGDAEGGDARAWTATMRRVRRNKAALVQHLVLLAQAVEARWADAAARTELLEVYRASLLDLAGEVDPDLAELARLGPKMARSLDFSLEHFLALALPAERKHSRGLRDADFIVTEHDRRGAAGGAAGAARREIPLVVVCDNLRSAFNVGSIFRTSECVGAKEVVLCGYTATPSDAGTAKAAMGMHELVPWRWERAAADAIAAARAQGLSVVALETAEGCPEAHRFAFPRGGVALVLGNERYGLSPALLELCDSVVQLPCRGVKNSLNVGVAFGVTAYEILRQWEMPPP